MQKEKKAIACFRQDYHIENRGRNGAAPHEESDKKVIHYRTMAGSGGNGSFTKGRKQYIGV